MRGGSGPDWGDEPFTEVPSSTSVTLTMRQGPNPGQRYTVHKENVTIGRLPGNDIAIPDPQVSRHHASITWENSQFVVRDLGSANGTAVNGVTISDVCPLRDGDVIALGEIVLTFQGSASLGDTSEEVYGSLAEPEPISEQAAPLRSGGTIVMPAGEPSGGASIWPVLIGVGLALFFALIVVAAVLYFALSQGQSSPELAVQQPTGDTRAQPGEPVLVLASATDRRGVTRAELWVDGTLNATISSNNPGGQPVLLIQQPWTPMTSGAHVLSIRAYNASGRASAPVEIRVQVTDRDGLAAGGLALATATPRLTSTAVVLSTPTPLASATATPLSCVNDSAFVADVTVPDNSVFRPGATIDKTWRIRNGGSCPWQNGYRLVFISGSKMGAPDNQPVVATAPGGTTDVTIHMAAPAQPGTYTGVWRMVDASGEPFGQRFTVVIQVPSPFTPTPVVPPTPTPLPGPLVNLSVERDKVSAGECTRLRGQVEGVSAAWLDGEAVVGGFKEKEVCPCDDTTYVLEAQMANGERVRREIGVEVDGTCVVEKPDLAVRDFEISDEEPRVGNSVQLRLRIKNQGAVKAKKFLIFWSPKGPDGGEWIQVANITDSIDPGESQWVEWDYTYEEDGDFDTEAVVDFHDQIDESNESNNGRELTVSPRS